MAGTDQAIPRQEESSNPTCSPRVLNVLEALKRASHELQAHPHLRPGSDYNPSQEIMALLELQTESDTILSGDPYLCNLSNHLNTLKSLVLAQRSSKGFNLRSFLCSRVSAHSISRVAESIGLELQAWIDREIVEEIVFLLEMRVGDDEEVIRLLGRIEKRVSQGFDRELQDLVLKSKLLRRLERALCDPVWSTQMREHTAFTIAALMKFNKDVFVGQVMLRRTILALMEIASVASLKVLTVLIRSIKSAIVDEIKSSGKIPKTISFLDDEDLQFRVAAMDCILEIGYFGRKEAIEDMLEAGLIEKLMELQWSGHGGTLIDSSWYNYNDGDGKENGGRRRKRWTTSNRERKLLEAHPFTSCVSRFAVQLGVGEGLRQRERRAFKRQILEHVREASATDSEAATIVAEVLWGSSP